MFCHVFLRRYVSGQYHESYLHGFTRSKLSHWLGTAAFETEYDKPFVAALFLGGILREIGIELKYMGLMWTQIHQPSTSLPDICAFVIHPSYTVSEVYDSFWVYQMVLSENKVPQKSQFIINISHEIAILRVCPFSETPQYQFLLNILYIYDIVGVNPPFPFPL